MFGPRDSPYNGGFVTISIVFPPDYPSHGPEFKFLNKIYHLNVDMENGHISLNHLNEWKGTGKVTDKKGYNVKNALFDIFCLFYNQGFESPYDENMARLYKFNREKFNEEARKWTKLYASKM